MAPADPIRFWSWGVEPDGPPLAQALAVGYALRAAALDAAAGLGLRLSDSLHDSWPDGGHRHAYWLSEDRDRDGAIDHVVMFVESGISPTDARALRATAEFSLGEQAFRLRAGRAGSRPKGGLFGPATVWMAATPFVTRLWRRTKTGKVRADFTPAAQVVREIGEIEDRHRKRRFPAPAGVAWMPAVQVGPALAAPGAFVLETEALRPNADAVAAFPVVTFPEPVEGPIALGYGAHFGLGLLVPADAEPGERGR